VSGSALPVPGQSASEAAYRDIKGWILSGDIPLGMRLGEGRVARGCRRRGPRCAKRYYGSMPSASSSVIRGRLSHQPSNGACDARALRRPTALELFAIRSAAANALDTSHPAHAQLIELRDEWLELAAEAPDGDAGFVVTDEDFHSRLAAPRATPSSSKR